MINQRWSHQPIRGGAANLSSGFLLTTYQGVPFRTGGEPVNLTSPEAISAARQRQALAAVRDNQLWQTDLFTFVLKRQNRRVYLVAFMDDHSRFITGQRFWR